MSTSRFPFVILKQNVNNLRRLLAILAVVGLTHVCVPPAKVLGNTDTLTEVLHLSVVDGVPIDEKGHGVTLGNDAYISTAPGVSSIALDGYWDFVRISDSPDWNLGTQDFIIECNFYIKSFENPNNGNVELATSDTWANGWMFGVGGLGNPGEGVLFFYDYPTDFTVASPPLTWNLDEWYNVKMVRNGMTLTIYRNDLAVGSGVTAVGFPGVGVLTISRIDGANTLNGYISSLRIAKGQPGINNQVPYPTPTGGGSYLHGAAVYLGGKVSDFDGDLVDYEWRENSILLFSGQVQTAPEAVPVHLPFHVLSTLIVGEHTFTLCINDGFHSPVCSDIFITILDQEEGQCVEPPANLVSWWPGDGNALDIWDGNPGTLMNGATFDQGFVGPAFSLDGAGEYVDLGTGNNLNFPTSDFTVDFWVNFRGNFSEEIMIEKYIETFGDPDHPRKGWTFTKLFSFPWEDSGVVRLHVADTSANNFNVLDVGTSIPPNTWIHAAVTRSGDTFTIYWNGVPVGSATFPGVNLDTLASLKLGHRGNPNDPPPSVSTGSLDTRDFYLNGLIDEVKIYNRALSALEIEGIYLAGRIGTCKATINAGPSNLWIGLKNSDDQGTQFDLRTELYVNDVLVSEGQTLCITGVTRNPSYAKDVTVPFGAISNGTYNTGDVLSVKVRTRIGTNPDGSKCSGPGGSHNNAVGLRLYYDASNRASGFGAEISSDPMKGFFLHSTGTNYFLNDVTPTGAVKYKDSSSVNFNNGNPWKEIGTWNMTLP